MYQGHEAIYEVTKGLRRLLLAQLSAVSKGALVTLLPPGDGLPDAPGVNLYLYRITESPFTRNQDGQPALRLQLSYLLTPLGAKADHTNPEAADFAHTMLGVALQTFYEHPLLNEVHLPDFDADAELPAALLRNGQPIRINLTAASLEEVAKIWAAINKPYRLSVAYEVSLVELATAQPAPVSSARVQTTDLDLFTLSPPQVIELTPHRGALARFTNNALKPDTLQLSGYGLSRPNQTPGVLIGDQRATLQTHDERLLTVELPLELAAGPQVDVRVTLAGNASQPLTFTVNPWLSELTPMRTALDPARGDADLRLRLHGFGLSNPQAVRFAGPGETKLVTAFTPGGTDKQAAIILPQDLQNGIYQVRVALDDNDNSVTNARTFAVIPRLDSPIAIAQIEENGKQVHRLTLQGARLNGDDIRLLIDGVTHQTKKNANAAQLQYTLKCMLNAGTHSISIVVDGCASRAVTLEL